MEQKNEVVKNILGEILALHKTIIVIEGHKCFYIFLSGDKNDTALCKTIVRVTLVVLSVGQVVKELSKEVKKKYFEYLKFKQHRQKKQQ